MTTKVSKISIALAATIAFMPNPAGSLDAMLGAPERAPRRGVALAAEQAPPKESPYLLPDTRPSRPLALREAIQTAIANNLDVAIRRKDPEAARFDVTEASAFFDPLVNATGTYSRSTGEPQTSFDPATSRAWRGAATWLQTLQQGFHYEVSWQSSKRRTPSLFNPVVPAYDSNLFLSFRQPLLRGFGFGPNRTNIEIAQIGITVNEESFRQTVIDTLRSAENAYWDLNAAISNLGVARESLKLANDLLGLNRKKVEVGTLAPIQITEAEASVASREEGVILAQADIQNAEDNLRRIMNVPPDSSDWGTALTPTDAAPFEPTTIELDTMIKAAMEKRPELQQARQDIRIKDLRHRLTENNRQIALDAVGSYGTAGNNYGLGNPIFADTDGDGTVERIETLKVTGLSDSASEVFSNDIREWSVGLNVSIPIGNRAARASEARARIALEQSQMSLENLERGIQVEVRTAVRGVETGVKRVQAARSSVILQEKKLEAEQKRYDNGMSTSFQVLSFQSDLTAARSAVIAAITAYNKAVVELGRVTATLPERRGVAIASRASSPPA